MEGGFHERQKVRGVRTVAVASHRQKRVVFWAQVKEGCFFPVRNGAGKARWERFTAAPR